MSAVMAVFFGLAGTATADAQVLREILNRMDAHNKALTSLRANVTMVKFNSQLNERDTSEGTTVYLPQKGKNALVRVDWVKPVKESLAVVGQEYVLYRPHLQQAIKGKVNTSKSKGTNNALAFMNMSKQQLSANYSVRYLGEESVAGGIKTWHLELTPKTATSYKSAELWVDGNGMPIQAMVVENNNDSTTVLLSGIEKNVKLDASVFAISPPKGTKIIKG